MTKRTNHNKIVLIVQLQTTIDVTCKHKRGLNTRVERRNTRYGLLQTKTDNTDYYRRILTTKVITDA